MVMDVWRGGGWGERWMEKNERREGKEKEKKIGDCEKRKEGRWVGESLNPPSLALAELTI